GRIISSGHFRNEHGRVDAALPKALADASSDVVLANVRAADGEFLALVRSQSFEIAGHPFTMIGGVKVDDAFVARLARDPAIGISLTYPGGTLASGPVPASLTTRENARNSNDVAIGELEIPLIRTTADGRVQMAHARLRVTQPLTALRTMLRGADNWLLMTA